MSEDGKPIFGDGNCARPGCQKPAREGQLMCGGHWWLVPLKTREKVWNTFRLYRRGSVPLGALRDAQQEAVDAVVARSNS